MIIIIIIILIKNIKSKHITFNNLFKDYFFLEKFFHTHIDVYFHNIYIYNIFQTINLVVYYYLTYKNE
ncbi:hypothetical protein PFNF135_05971 [Plasmodium falciparum NF135/5.C10]|uniref:Uncharacterized protein n=1 Tax=Plasmodium falciparum NF135/5.C10 TaxID=1036726 RepID=W4IA67_PLAFA|nr:hypothetical protein PFNF135_05971 [Plasmodium falciparum NF135/5.C10]